jgi:hypothetical protein
MGIHIALLIVSIDAKQWLQVGPRMDAAIQPPKPVLASMWEDDLVLEGALLTGQQRKYHAMVPCRAGGLGGQQMPEFRRRKSPLCPDDELHADVVPLKHP